MANQITFTQLNIAIREGNHLFLDTALDTPKIKLSDILVDTGYSFGFAFSKSYLAKFKFTDGFLSSMLLADDEMVKGITFLVDTKLILESKEFSLGKVSFVFIDKIAESLCGVEFLKHLSPITADWNSKKVTYLST